MDVKIRRALLSAFRKDGVVGLGQCLSGFEAEILSTGGTARCLNEAGVITRDVADVTGYPEMMDGRVKTLHPRIHGGLLFRRDVDSHREVAESHGIPQIDLLYVDLYPFEQVVARGDATSQEIIEMIDIGGPAMIRSASKNHSHVLVIVDPADLQRIQEELEELGGAVSLETRKAMAAKAFRRTAAYDALIADWLGEEPFPERLVIPLERRAIARYGENPHQRGAIYARAGAPGGTVATAEQLSGKELSYNNFLDASAAWEVVENFEQPTAAVIKHRNPCGASSAETVEGALEKTWKGDPLSAFGGILAINRPVTVDLAKSIASPDRFLEVIIAPDFENGVVDTLKAGVRWGRNVRLLKTCAKGGTEREHLIFRSIHGGALLQDPDPGPDGTMKVVSSRQPTEAELRDLALANALCLHVTSNAIVFVKDQMLVGAGAGQMSRVDSVEIAAKKADERSRGAVMGSDAFFPFPDGVVAAAEAGVTAVIQPGGSMRDPEVIAAADKHGLAMVFSGRRHFRH